jgi:hypothetical protein
VRICSVENNVMHLQLLFTYYTNIIAKSGFLDNRNFVVFLQH